MSFWPVVCLVLYLAALVGALVMVIINTVLDIKELREIKEDERQEKQKSCQS